jgi:transposase
VCAVDVAEADLVACVPVAHQIKPGRRLQEIRGYSTSTAALRAPAGWRRCQPVQSVALEASSDYWKPVYYLLEAQGFECWLLNAGHGKNVPGRPKTDRPDAVGLAKVAERGMCRPSFVPPEPIRQLRDLSRYRRSLVRERTREKQRLEKLPEDAQVEPSSVIEDICGVSGRQMLEEMIGGRRDPKMLARLARGRRRARIGVLQEALRGHFEDHHAFPCPRMVRRIDALSADIGEVDTRIEELVVTFAGTVRRLDEIVGVAVTSAHELIAETGVNRTVFPTAAHLVSWAKFAPVDNSCAGKKAGSTGKGNPRLAATLGEVGAATARTDTFLGERYRRLVNAVVSNARSLRRATAS